MSWEASALAKKIRFFADGTKLTAVDKCVLMVLGEYTHPETEVAWPSIQTLADDCGLTANTCRAVVHRLAAGGIIRIIPHKTEGNVNLSNRYLFRSDLPNKCLAPPKKINEINPQESGVGTPSQREDVLPANRRETDSRTNNEKETPSDFSLSGESVGKVAKASKGKKQREDKPAADPRHNECVKAITHYWDYMNAGLEGKCPFSGRLFPELSTFLKTNPKLTVEEFQLCLQNRGESDGISPTEDPAFWVGRLLKFQAGPLDRYGLRPEKPPKK